MGLISRVSSRTYRKSYSHIIMSKDSKDTKVSKALDKEQQSKVFEDDDEFEEFPVDDWEPSDEQQTSNKNAWQENWDDDDVEEDFSAKLKNILTTKGHMST